MYCPVDGMEYREGITRCPQHDVDLVDEPPDIDEEPSWLETLGADDAMRRGFRVVAWAAVVYAVCGVLVSGWFALAQRQRWTPGSFLDLLIFGSGAARTVLLASVACMAAAVLVRTFARLGSRAPATEPVAEHDPDLEGAMAWVVPLLTALVVVFAAVWAVTGVVVAWDEADAGAAGLAQFVGSSAPFTNVMALHKAAYACGLGALVILGALLMGRAYDRLAGIR